MTVTSRAGRRTHRFRVASQLVPLFSLVLLAWSGPRLLHATGPDAASVIVEQLTASAGEWNRGSLEGFIAPYAHESTFMTPAGPIGRAAMVDRYRETYFGTGRPRQSLRFEQLEVRLLGSDHALMTGRFVLSGGALPEQSGRFTLVWVHSQEGWRILHDHTS
jgi:ketosteroid isomerase-like protein